MIRYLKYIVLVFGTIGISVASFFVYQNRVDVSKAIDYNSIIDYDYLKTHCLNVENDYYYPCLKDKFSEFLGQVSLTGSNIGLRMMFSVMEEDKRKTTHFKTQKLKDLVYTINYLEVNNLTMDNAYQRYFGIKALYGGFLSSLKEFYSRATLFSDDLITGLESPKGISGLESSTDRELLALRLRKVSDNYYSIKKRAIEFIDIETARIKAAAK